MWFYKYFKNITKTVKLSPSQNHDIWMVSIVLILPTDYVTEIFINKLILIKLFF